MEAEIKESVAPQFKENLLGRLSNFPLSVEKPLLPIFEAIANALHAIEDSKRKDGRITIQVHRSPPVVIPMADDLKPTEPVCGFTIEDNGIGFTQANFTSFCTADSTFKKARGGKGVGRLSWLKVFEKAEIESRFKDGKTVHRRTFSFALADNPIATHEITSASSNAASGTIIRLVGIRPEYKKHCPKQFDTIARKIIEHFLTLFILPQCPTIQLIDADEGENQSLNTFFEKEIGRFSTIDKIKVNGFDFRLQHFKMPTRSNRPEHQLHFCARDRSVETKDVSGFVSNLDGPLHGEDEKAFCYAGYLSGKLFDDDVNQERTAITMFHQKSLFDDEDSEAIIEELLEQVAKKAQTFLDPFLLPIKTKKLERIAEYIQKRPRFRPLTKLRADWLDEIRADVSDDDLDIELYKLMHRLEIEVRKDGTRLRSEQAQFTSESIEQRKKKFDKFLDESNQVGFSKLADYVVHRRAVIEFLADCMKLNEDGRYKKEEVVHDVIFPMRTTSNMIPDPDQSNLWMIDERLAYHYYLSSDTEFRGIEEIKVKKKHQQDRIDLLVLQPYDRPHAFVGTSDRPFDAVTIIEFKRPMRDDYSEEDEDRDPVQQVWRYADKIQKGEVKDRSGHFILRWTPKTGPGNKVVFPRFHFEGKACQGSESLTV